MPSPYPYELRVRVIKAAEAKMAIAEVMRVFNVCRDQGNCMKFKFH